LATLKLWQINPRHWLQWYLQSCAEAGSQAPKDIEPFLPWNLSSKRRRARYFGLRMAAKKAVSCSTVKTLGRQVG
jgi:hypothetical protein